MSYSADTFVADEQPTTAKWNKLWNNDASFNDGTGIGAGVINAAHRSQVAKVGKFTVTGNGAHAVTGVGFQPKALFLMQLDSDHISASVANFAIGFSDGSVSASSGFRAQESSDISGSIDSTNIIFTPGTNQAKSYTLVLTSFNSDGFTVTVSNYGANNNTYAYIAWA